MSLEDIRPYRLVNSSVLSPSPWSSSPRRKQRQRSKPWEL